MMVRTQQPQQNKEHRHLINALGHMCIAVISDVVLWFALGTLLLGGILAMDWKDLPFLPKSDASVSLHVPDAYSLTKGSPVNFMGVRVGSVKKVYVSESKDTVHVDLSLNEWIKTIPANAEANIVAAGLGGAKRLEFTLPYTMATETSDAPSLSQQEGTIKVLEPFRQKTMWAHQNRAANALRHGADGLGKALSFIEVGSQYKMLQDTLNQLDTSSIHIARYQHQLPQLGERLRIFTLNLEDSFQQLDAKLHTLNEYANAWNAGQGAQFKHNVQQSRTMLRQQRQLLQDLNQRLQLRSNGAESLQSITSSDDVGSVADVEQIEGSAME